MLARLADVVARELARVQVARSGGSRGEYDAGPGPLELLRRAGRELDCSALPVVLVDGERGGFLTAALHRTVIVEYSDGWREPVRVDRVQIEAGDVAWRDVVSSTWNSTKPATPSRPAPSRPTTCARCGAPLPPQKAGQMRLYCSTSCQNRANRERRRQAQVPAGAA